MDKGIIMWAVFLIVIVAGMLVSRMMKKGINESGELVLQKGKKKYMKITMK